MPELPEVETIGRGLGPVVAGRQVVQVELRRAGLRVPFPEGLAKALEGRRVEGISRRAKYLLWRFEGGVTMLSHLGMTGKWLYHAPGVVTERQAHDHVVMRLGDGAHLTYNDARRFGMIGLAATPDEEAHACLAKLGPEPLGNGFSEGYLREALARRSGPVKVAIMDQALVVGVGNIYASEALFRAKVRPGRVGKAVTAAEVGRLHRAIREVLEEAIAAGGSTLRDYVRSSGDVGSFQHHFAVYDRKGLNCERCDGLVVREVMGGRATFWCAACQK